jgi:predicted Fe-Mo cluster-binding NifX family protein
MKIVVPIQNNTPESKVSLTFARSPWFALWEKPSGAVDFIANPYRQEKIGVGSRIFELLITENEANTLLAYELGLKVQQLAVKNKIQLIIINNRNQTLSDILQLSEQKKKDGES